MSLEGSNGKAGFDTRGPAINYGLWLLGAMRTAATEPHGHVCHDTIRKSNTENSMNQAPSISVAIPVYHEEAVVPEL